MRVFKMNKIEELQKIKELYALGFTNREIGLKLGTSKTRVGDICLKNGFKKNILNPTFEQMSVLIGTVIGDGGVYKSTPNSEARIQLSHCLEQEKYLRWKYSIVCDLIKSEPVYKNQFDKRTLKTYRSIKIQSRVNRIYTKMRSDWYNDAGKKIINFDELMKYDELVLAIKYFDDGCINNIGNYSIAMNDYSIDCINKFRDWLKIKFDINTTVHGSKVVYILKESRVKLSVVLNKYATDDVRYKINGEN